MRVTPLDIIQKQDAFTPSRRGVDADEVREFLDQVRETLEELLQENQRFRDQLVRRDAEIIELKGAESNIKDTLVLAQRLSEDLSRRARRESDLIVGEARLEAQQILRTAAEERRTLQAEIIQLQAARVRLGADLRAVLDVHLQLLERLDAPDPSASASSAAAAAAVPVR